MAEVTTIMVRHESGENAVSIAERLVLASDKGGIACAKLAALLEESASTTKRNVELHTGGTSVAITVDDSAITVNDVVSIGEIDLTAVASNPSTDEFVFGSSDAATASNLAAAINAQATLKQVAVATASGAVVSVAFTPGVLASVVPITFTVDSGTPFTAGSPTGTSTRTVYPLRRAAR